MRKSTASIIVLTLLAFCLSLTACATAPVAVPQTFSQQLAFAYGLTDGIASTTEALYRNEVISHEEATDVFNALQEVWKLLDTAKQMHEAFESKDVASPFAGDDFQGTLDAAMKILQALRSHLVQGRS